MFQPFVDVTFGGVLLGTNCNNGNLGNACGALTAVNLPAQLPTVPPGVTIIALAAHPNATASHSVNSFAPTAGGGFDIKFSITCVFCALSRQSHLSPGREYSCQFAYCGNNDSQANFRPLCANGFLMGREILKCATRDIR